MLNVNNLEVSGEASGFSRPALKLALYIISMTESASPAPPDPLCFPNVFMKVLPLFEFQGKS